MENDLLVAENRLEMGILFLSEPQTNNELYKGLLNFELKTTLSDQKLS